MLCGVSQTQLHILSQLPYGGSAWQCTYRGGGSQRESRRAGTCEEGFLSIIKERERERAGHRQDQDIVQRSASEQAQYSPSIWYSIFV